jgi:hypothetical protein
LIDAETLRVSASAQKKRKSMARYKEYSYDQGKLIPTTIHEQIILGTTIRIPI